MAGVIKDGFLEKRIQRPFGIVVWQKRQITLTTSEIIVRNPAKKDETKRYLYESVVLAPVAAAPSGRHAFSLLDVRHPRPPPSRRARARATPRAPDRRSRTRARRS